MKGLFWLLGGLAAVAFIIGVAVTLDSHRRRDSVPPYDPKAGSWFTPHDTINNPNNP